MPEYKKCPSTTIIIREKVILNNVEHSAAVAHICKLEKGHEDNCECECGRRFVRNSKEY